MNIICKVWGHREFADENHSWCDRCDALMSEYSWENEDLPHSFNLSRFWYQLKYRVSEWQRSRRAIDPFSEDDIPF